MTKEELNAFRKKHIKLNATLSSHKMLACLLGVKQGTCQNWCWGARSVPMAVHRMIKLYEKYPDMLKAELKECEVIVTKAMETSNSDLWTNRE